MEDSPEEFEGFTDQDESSNLWKELDRVIAQEVSEVVELLEEQLGSEVATEESFDSIAEDGLESEISGKEGEESVGEVVEAVDRESVKAEGEAAAIKVEQDNLLQEDVEEEGRTYKEVEESLNRMTELRNNLVKVNVVRKTLIEEYNQVEEEQFVKDITDSIRKLRSKKKDLARNEVDEGVSNKENQKKAQMQKVDLLLKGVERLVVALNEELSVKKKVLSESEVTKKNAKITKVEEKVFNLETKIAEVVKEMPADHSKRDEIVEKIGKHASNVFEMFTAHKQDLVDEVKKRDIDPSKKEATKEIRMESFSGVEEGQDFYSFKSKFDKKFKDCRKNYLHEILKSYLSK